ncbi:hypothetical protein ACFW04_011797 [Cataglyphis niger]
MNNTVFGKTMKNICNHVNVKLLTKWDGRFSAEAMIAKPNFINLEIKFNKSIYRYGPRLLVQHIDDCKYVVVAFVETRVRTHLDNVSLPQVIVTSDYDASSGKISSRWSMQFLDKS